jgi:putative aldouronate transport system substrate-binding protein
MDKRDEVYGDLEEPLSGGIGLETPYWFAVETFLQDSNMAVCNIEGIMDIAGYDANTVFNLYGTQEYREACKSVQRMVDRNILAYDYEGKTAWNATGHIFAWPGWGYTYMPEHLFSDGFTTRMIEPVRVWTDTNNYVSAGTAISANTKNPERLMMFLEMVNNDPFLATMMRFGIEGQHYIRDAEGKMHFEGSLRNSDNANPGYRYWYAAPLGNLLIVEAPESYSGPGGIMLTKMKQFNDNAKLPSHMGFIYDIEPVSTEIAACTSVVLEYRDMLRNGRLSSGAEVDEAIDEFLQKLDANGLQAVIDDVQRQINEWNAAR